MNPTMAAAASTMLDPHSVYLLVAALSAIIVLILLIAVGRINPFIVMISVSLALGLVTGMPIAGIVKSFETGLGGTLGHIAIVVSLGTMLGKMMAESGGADRIARTMIDAFGTKNVHWAMMAIGLIVGTPVFFEVGFVLLIPIVFTVAKRTGVSLLLVGLPMLVGLSVVHGLIPPHPAALMAVATYNADIGKTIFYGLLVGIPTAIVAGPIFCKWVAPKIAMPLENPMADTFTERLPDHELPGFGITLFTILLPVFLMLLGSWANLLARENTTPNSVLHFLGNPDISLLLAVLVSFITFGKMRGVSRDNILKFTNECLGPMANITLLVGAGGGLGRILMDSGVSNAIVSVALQAHVSILLMAWLVAALIRVATGSATVSMSTAAVIIAPLASHTVGAQPELLAIATGAGALTLSHVNDGAFWMVKEYFNISVAQTLKTWTVCETIISVLALVFTIALSHLI